MIGIIQKILIHRKSGKKFLVKEMEEFHTSAGVISKKDLSSSAAEVKSSKGEVFLMLEPSFVDLWEFLQRGQQVVIQKDIGLILAKTAVNGNSRVVDAGGGSGSLCLYLANVCQEVTTYEINEEHYRIILKNKALCGLDNLTVKKEDVYKGISERELDLVTLDLPEPWRVLGFAEEALKMGGFLVVYATQLTQVKDCIDALKKSSIRVLEVVELLERKWKIEEKIMRPEHEMLGHTGFLLLGRKW